MLYQSNFIFRPADNILTKFWEADDNHAIWMLFNITWNWSSIMYSVNLKKIEYIYS